MKYRIMTEKGTQDFNTLAEAQTLLTTEKARVNLAVKPTDKNKPVPFVSYHICNHDKLPFKPCVIIEKVIATKEV